MKPRSQRLEHIHRKFALDQRRAMSVLARAVSEHGVLRENVERLRAASSGLNAGGSVSSGADLASSGEWRVRLDQAVDDLLPLIAMAGEKRDRCLAEVHATQSRSDRLRQLIVEARSFEAATRDARFEVRHVRIARKPC